MGVFEFVNLADKAKTLIDIGKSVVSGGNPIGPAYGATKLFKQWVDSHGIEVFEAVQKREGCPHIIMLDGGMSSPAMNALEYVSHRSGVAWAVGESAVYFWHKDRTFGPMVFTNAYLIDGRTVKTAKSKSEYERIVPRPKDGYTCRQCEESREKKRKS